MSFISGKGNTPAESSRASVADEPDENSVSNLDLDKFTSENEVFDLFQMWKNETKREYQIQEEESQRFQIFKSNLKYIREKNAERKSPSDCKLGLNQFSDMSYEEFSKIYLHETEEPIIESNSGKMVENWSRCTLFLRSFKLC